MRRRRQKNTLLPKMMGIATLIVAILLPILLQTGAFKLKEGKTVEFKLVQLPPEKKRPQPKHAAARKHIAKAKPRPEVSRGRSHVAERPAKPNPNLTKVIASKPSADGTGGPTVDQGTKSAGTLPVNSTPPTAASSPSTPTTSTAVAPPKPVETPTPQPPVVAPPHVPVIVAAKVVSEPKPKIPEDLLDQDLNSTFRALFTVHADGTASVEMLNSTGNKELDSIALDTAKKWSFSPATKDGVPVESYLRLIVEFEVS